MSKQPLSRKQRQLQDEPTIYAANVVKFATLLVLRNQGWGKIRLNRFSKKFDEILVDINADRLSFTDISIALEEETGLSRRHFMIDIR